MDARPDPLLPSTSHALQPSLMQPQQVWVNLTQSQQRNVLQTVVLVCQDLFTRTSPEPGKEAPHE
jgi:hypothetical protein